jgi:class 3 adenylate cyclase
VPTDGLPGEAAIQSHIAFSQGDRATWPKNAQRRLAAILAADVVGYSRLMGADEVGTLAALKARRQEILQPLVAKHHGRIVKLMGDGVLVEFASALYAVSCAVELQNAMAIANASLPDKHQIVLRVGINLSESTHGNHTERVTPPSTRIF